MSRDHHFQAMLLRGLALERDEGTRVPRGDETGCDRRLHRRASPEQTERLGDRDTMLAEALSDVLMRDAELVDEPAQATSFLDRVQVGALQVLDQAQDELLVISGLGADNRRHGLEAGEPRRTPASLARDQLVTVGESPDEQRLQDTVEPD